MKKLNFTTKTAIAVYSMLAVVLSSCTDAGTLKRIDKGNNEQIEVFKYFYDDGEFVYVARFKDTTNVITTTWTEQQGKMRITKGNVVIFENDSIKVALKNCR
jgi:hypothetical protein